MARNNQGRSGNQGRSNNQGRSRNNNPEGRNQYSGSIVDRARERPIAAAAVAAGAAATGLFLWSKRSQITDQLGSLSDQIGEWSENMRSGESSGMFSAEDDSGSDALVSNRGRRSGSKNQQQFAEEAMTLKETGNPGGNASVSGRGRKSSTTTS